MRERIVLARDIASLLGGLVWDVTFGWWEGR